MKIKQAPPMLWAYAAVLVAHGLVEVFLDGGLTLAGFVISLVVTWFVLRGSRFFWFLALLLSAGDAVVDLAVETEPWLIVLGSLRLVFLLMPSSRGFFWQQPRVSRIEAWIEERATWRSIWRLVGILVLLLLWGVSFAQEDDVVSNVVYVACRGLIALTEAALFVLLIFAVIRFISGRRQQLE
jgi:hypothetical protein